MASLPVLATAMTQGCGSPGGRPGAGHRRRRRPGRTAAVGSQPGPGPPWSATPYRGAIDRAAPRTRPPAAGRPAARQRGTPRVSETHRAASAARAAGRRAPHHRRGSRVPWPPLSAAPPGAPHCGHCGHSGRAPDGARGVMVGDCGESVMAVAAPARSRHPQRRPKPASIIPPTSRSPSNRAALIRY